MESRPLASLSLSSSTLAALAKAGYETIEDLYSSSVDSLTKELRLPPDEIQDLLSRVQKRGSTSARVPLSQPVSVLTEKDTERQLSTLCPPIDHLLGGGLSRGTILELSGPPGCPKESAAISIVKSFTNEGKHVIFADCQNMTSPGRLHQICGPAAEGAIHYIRLHAMSDLMIFLHTLRTHLDAHPKVSLLVLNSVSFPFQTAALSMPSRNSLLDQIKQILAKSCATHDISVVTTTQLATKLIGADGLPANFDTADARGIMVPQLGPAYLPTTRSYRMVFAPSSRRTGVIQLLTRPLQQPQHPPVQVAYEVSSRFELFMHNE